MEKRKMMTFYFSTRLTIDVLASVFLLFLTVKLFAGVVEGSQTRVGNLILIVFALLFLAGGCAGILRSIIRYRKYKTCKEKGGKLDA